MHGRERGLPLLRGPPLCDFVQFQHILLSHQAIEHAIQRRTTTSNVGSVTSSPALLDARKRVPESNRRFTFNTSVKVAQD